jgi:GAF domain-containing protein
MSAALSPPGRVVSKKAPQKTPKKIPGGVQKELALLHRISESISSQLALSAVLREIVQMVLDVTRADACLIYLLDDPRKELVLRASSPPHPKLIGRIHLELGEGITGWVAKERHTVAISKNAEVDPRFTPFRALPEDRFQAFLSTPVISRGEVIGVINVQHRKAHRHSESEVALLTVIGHQVGSAIENARVHQEAQRKAMQIDTLSRVSQTVASGQYLEEILHLIVAMTAGMMGSKICSIMLLDEVTSELKVVATQSLSDEYRRKAVKVEGSFSGRALKERRPIMVADVTRDPGYGRPEMAVREGLCSLLSVPMVVKGRAIGVINLYTGAPHHFTQEESSLLRTVADQAAIAIENTRLLERASL